jgi:RNA polymerase sigma-70 factor (ECF subfamily)
MKLDRSQFEKLAMEHLDMLYRIARRLTRDEATAEDLVQETYLRALRFYQNFDLKEFGIRPWLLRILHNLHTTRFQREKRQPVAIDDAQLQAATATGNGYSALADGNNIWDGMDEQLVRAVESLPEEYQTAMILWAIDELSYKEIAEALEVPIGTVMSRLHRARARLSEQLRGYATEHGIGREAGGHDLPHTAV